MRTILTILIAAAALSAQSDTFELQPGAGAKITLTVEKTGLWSGRKHVFEFERYRGVLRFDRSAPTQSQVEFSIEAGSALCRDAWLKQNDRKKVLDFMSREMLDVERHPRLSFRSTAVVATGENAFDVSGVLRVRGVDRPARMMVTIETSGGALVSAAGRSIIRLTEYGLKPPKAALGTIGTKDEMSVEFRLAPRVARIMEERRRFDPK